VRSDGPLGSKAIGKKKKQKVEVLINTSLKRGLIAFGCGDFKASDQSPSLIRSGAFNVNVVKRLIQG